MLNQKACLQLWLRATESEAHTVKNGAVCSQEAVLESLGIVARLEGILIENDVVDVFAGEQCNLVAAMTVKNTEEGKRNVDRSAGRGFQVEHSRVRVFHADAPALHGGDAVDKSFILALVGSLG